MAWRTEARGPELTAGGTEEGLTQRQVSTSSPRPLAVSNVPDGCPGLSSVVAGQVWAWAGRLGRSHPSLPLCPSTKWRVELPTWFNSLHFLGAHPMSSPSSDWSSLYMQLCLLCVFPVPHCVPALEPLCPSVLQLVIVTWLALCSLWPSPMPSVLSPFWPQCDKS